MHGREVVRGWGLWVGKFAKVASVASYGSKLLRCNTLGTLLSQSTDPYWDEMFVFDVRHPAFAVLKVKVYDHLRCWRPGASNQVEPPMGYLMRPRWEACNALAANSCKAARVPRHGTSPDFDPHVAGSPHLPYMPSACRTPVPFTAAFVGHAGCPPQPPPRQYLYSDWLNNSRPSSPSLQPSWATAGCPSSPYRTSPRATPSPRGLRCARGRASRAARCRCSSSTPRWVARGWFWHEGAARAQGAARLAQGVGWRRASCLIPVI